MYGAGNPQMAALGALGALGGPLRELAMAPVRRWSQTSLFHKVIAAGAGAGLAYYLHTKGMADAAVAVAGLGGAYVTSAIMHYPKVVQNGGSVLGSGQPVSGMLPAAHVENMVAQAYAVMNGGAAGAGQTSGGALAPAGAVPASAQQQTVIGAQTQQQPMGGAPNPNSKWAALG